MAHDEKLRLLVIKYKDSGHTFAQTNEAFGVSSQSYYGGKAEPEEKGNFGNHYPKSRPGKTDPKKLIEKTWANMKKELRNTAPLHGLIETAIYDYLN
jgi:transposase